MGNNGNACVERVTRLPIYLGLYQGKECAQGDLATHHVIIDLLVQGSGASRQRLLRALGRSTSCLELILEKCRLRTQLVERGKYANMVVRVSPQ